MSFNAIRSGTVKLSKECAYCNKVFHRGKQSYHDWYNVRKYCSTKCQKLSLRGREPVNKGKIGLKSWSDEQKLIRRIKAQERRENSTDYNFSSPRWRSVRLLALLRDDYTCQKCGLREPGIMAVDHIKPKKLAPELTYVLSNAMTLCPTCHARKTVQDRKDIKEYKKRQRQIEQTIEV